ncbi:THUM2 protein, partial [Grantiella picta]|nr:THUM2 protein [Grantiella picta]
EEASPPQPSLLNMSSAEAGRFFCTAGRGMEPFLARELHTRLGAAEVDSVSGKVFFSTAAGLGELSKLRSGERLFLLVKKHRALQVARNKGKMLHEIKSLVVGEPKYWLDIISVWRKLHGHEGKKDDVSREENTLPVKRKSEEETNTASKRQKMEQAVSEECQVEAAERCVSPERMNHQECSTESEISSELLSKGSGENPTANHHLSFTFRVSCRCSGAIAKILTPQEIGRAIGVALVKQFGWRVDLRNPDLEIFVHLNDIHSVVGIPLFRLPLANRDYIRTAGLRSTVAWAMASLAEISAGALVLDPMCGLGTILLEAAKEWPEAFYWGADISDSQLEGADGNIRAAGLVDKIELLQASVKALPLPSESFDSIISDIPFGKKFKVTNDTQLLPGILQEMERLLRVGGTLILLLSQDLHQLMDNLTKKSAGNDSSEPKKTLNNGNSSSLANGGGESFRFLVPDGVFGVSLGKTDAFIHKFRKISPPAGNW